MLMEKMGKGGYRVQEGERGGDSLSIQKKTPYPYKPYDSLSIKKPPRDQGLSPFRLSPSLRGVPNKKGEKTDEKKGKVRFQESFIIYTILFNIFTNTIVV